MVSLAVQTTQSQHLNCCTISLLLPTTCFGHSFDHHKLASCKYKKEKFHRRGLPFYNIFPFSTCIFLPDDGQTID